MQRWSHWFRLYEIVCGGVPMVSSIVRQLLPPIVAVLLLVTCVGAALAQSTGPDCSAAPRRVALVIGIADYQYVNKLSNPINDARAMQTLLELHCFEVMAVHDANHEPLLVALSEFRIAADGAELALVYYAGHGIHYDGSDILLPKSLPARCSPRTRRDALVGTVGLDEVMFAASGAKNRVVILDACRTTSFPTCQSRGDDAGFRALGRYAETRGALIATSTSRGRVASDGPRNGHSPFNEILRAHLSAYPRALLHEVLIATNRELSARPDGQTPGLYFDNGIPPPVCLAWQGCPVTGPAISSQPTSPAPQSPPTKSCSMAKQPSTMCLSDYPGNEDDRLTLGSPDACESRCCGDEKCRAWEYRRDGQCAIYHRTPLPAIPCADRPTHQDISIASGTKGGP